jgi:hypothetical protein
MPITTFTNADYGRRLTWWEIKAWGIDELINDINNLELNWDRESEKILLTIARQIRKAAQPRSPYLYGVLREAHFESLIHDASFWGGRASIVAIDPTVEHPILGGRPNIYGAEIHAGLRGEHRPWFVWTLEQDVPSILEDGGNEMKGIYAEYLNQTMFGAI